MDIETLIAGLREQALLYWDLIKTHPLETIAIILGVIIGFKFIVKFYRYLYAILIVPRRLVYLKITMPREESQKDKEKAEEKDFKEKISVMEQFFRNINEIGELSLQNIISTMLYKADIVSFELVAQKKVVEFYVVT
jgi:hypothetical protein